MPFYGVGPGVPSTYTGLTASVQGHYAERDGFYPVTRDILAPARSQLSLDVVFDPNPKTLVDLEATYAQRRVLGIAGLGAGGALLAASIGYLVYNLIASRELAYAGGEIGLGAEIRISRFFAVNGDVRGFIRQNIAGGSPEFTEVVSGGNTRSTDLSGGVYGNIGLTFYFFGN